MPPKRPAPKRKPAARKPAPRRARAPLPWSAILWALLLANIGAGLALSPLTGLSKVRLEGAMARDAAVMAQELQSLRGVPFLRVETRSVEDRLRIGDHIASVTYIQNIFGRGHGRVRYRVPVARIEGSDLCVDASGVVFAARESDAKLPALAVPRETRGPTGLLTGSWPAQRLAWLAQEIHRRWPDSNWTIRWERGSVISAESKGFPRLVFGSPSDLEKKIKQLGDIIAQNPRLLNTAREINLTAPNEPVSR